MAPLLVQTKLSIPLSAPAWPPRLHLVELLEEGLRAGHRLSLFTVPTGSGKTILLSEWCNSIFLASKGYHVVGVDISLKAIDRARQRPEERDVVVEFLQANVAELVEYKNRFDTVIDIDCFHSLEETDYANYASSPRRACCPRAVIHLRAFSDLNVRREGYTGPAVSEE